MRTHTSMVHTLCCSIVPKAVFFFLFFFFFVYFVYQLSSITVTGIISCRFRFVFSLSPHWSSGDGRNVDCSCSQRRQLEGHVLTRGRKFSYKRPFLGSMYLFPSTVSLFDLVCLYVDVSFLYYSVSV